MSEQRDAGVAQRTDATAGSEQRPSAPGREQSAPEPVERRAEALAASLLGGTARKHRMLVIVNPYATTVSDRLRNLVVYALRSRYEVDAVDTEARGHATQLCREAAREGYDLVCAFGGDGTVNEAANGLVGSDTPLTTLPGGSANIFCRTLGIPADVVDATEHLLRLADQLPKRRVDLGVVDDRHFLFAAGIGLDAEVTARVDAHPRLKARFGPWYYAWCAFAIFNRRYLFGRPPQMRVTLPDGRSVEAITCVAQNSDPYTFFAQRPIRVCRQAALDSGELALAALRRVAPFEVPGLIARLLSGRARLVANHRRICDLGTTPYAAVETLDGRPLPLHVDGDYLGERPRIELRSAPRALVCVA